MSNLLTSLLTSANTLSAYDQILQVSQNNISNANTPGFVKQRQALEALPFDPTTGRPGGVAAGDVVSARDEYAEQSVRRQNVLLGQAQQDVGSLTQVQSAFDISGDSGIPGALNGLFQSFSAWAQSPNDPVARQTVIEHATDVASAFQQTAANLTQTALDTQHTLAASVDAVNTLSGRLCSLNRLALANTGADSSLDAQIHSTLEDLSQYVSFTATQREDGSVTVLMNGETPLVVDGEQHKLSWTLTKPTSPEPTYTDAPGSLRLLAADGSDVTGKTTSGQLGSLLNTANTVLPAYLGDARQQGDLNRMAEQFAQRVNNLLTSGNVTDGPPAQAGVALFTYDANSTNAAATLAVDRNAVKPGLLGAIQPGPPYVSNGIPLALSGLASPQNSADKIDSESFTQFYGSMAARSGSLLNDANARVSVQQSTLSQAKNLRQQMSGVSLDEEATIVIQFQRAYEATSRMISILNQLTEDTINLLHA